MDISKLQLDTGDKKECKLVLSAESYEILACNQSAANLYNYEKQQLIGKNFSELCPKFLIDCTKTCTKTCLHNKNNNIHFYAHSCCFELINDGFKLLFITIIPKDESNNKNESELFSLVTGIAHELNTPTGNIILTTSTLINFISEINKSLENKSLSKDELKKLLIKLEQSGIILSSSANKISKLVEQVKRIAVSWMFECLSSFNLLEYVENILQRHKAQNKNKNKNITFNIDCPETLYIYHDSAAFIQVIEEFINNSYLHAFKTERTGNIFIKIQQDKNYLNIDYWDDGSNYTEKENAHLFEPFYTTARHKKLLGLGMNMVYNIVYFRLKGHITSSINENGSCHINLTFPLLNETEQLIEHCNITEF